MKKAGLKLCIISNALEERVRIVGEKLGIPWVARAIKPRKSPFKKALALLGTTPGETATVGDQLFTDIWGGNRMALFTIWTAADQQAGVVFHKNCPASGEAGC